MYRIRPPPKRKEENMLEEQGVGIIKRGAEMLFRLLKAKIAPVLSSVNRSTTIKIKSEPAKQSVKSLVKSGNDLKLSEVINNDEHLKRICKECKSQGIVFAIRKEKDGSKQLLYKKKDADLVEKGISKVLTDELKPKRTLKEIMTKFKEVSAREASKIKNKEVERDAR